MRPGLALPLALAAVAVSALVPGEAAAGHHADCGGSAPCMVGCTTGIYADVVDWLVWGEQLTSSSCSYDVLGLGVLCLGYGVLYAEVSPFSGASCWA